jgi:glycerate-2-kinase
LADALPQAVMARLQAGLAGDQADTPKAGDVAFRRSQTLIIADNGLAAAAARDKAAGLGFNALVLSTFVEGEAREVAKVAVALGREVVTHDRPAAPPACLILGGETTVTVRGGGKGGRNQELALAAALLLDRVPEGSRILVASLASDGTDGTTDAAGGLVDAMTVARGRAQHLDAVSYLADNNAHAFLQAVGDLLVTGPTQTNVNDLIAIFVL